MKVFLIIGDRLAHFTEAIARFHNAIIRFRETAERFRDDIREWACNVFDEEFTIVVRVVPRNAFILTNHIAPGGVWRFPDMRAYKRQRHPRWNGG